METVPSVGICEDDPELRDVLRLGLERAGLAVSACATGAEAVARFRAQPPDALVLDVGLPDADGRDVCQALRAAGVGAPILFLTARDALVDRLSGFHAGGDDYLTKPFELSELVVRLHALIRRANAAVGRSDDPVGLSLDPAAHAAVFGDQRVSLTPTEFRLLAALVARPGEVVRRHALVSAGWPDGAIVHDNTLDAFLARVRRKLREIDADASIETVRGVGYVVR